MKDDKETVFILDEGETPGSYSPWSMLMAAHLRSMASRRFPSPMKLERVTDPAPPFPVFGRIMMAPPNPSAEEEEKTEPQADYFVTERKLVVDNDVRAKRIMELRRQTNCCPGEAVARVNGMILTEMLGQMKTDDDLQMIRTWAAHHIK